jgi:SAM-dependent methyltransferase
VLFYLVLFAALGLGSLAASERLRHLFFGGFWLLAGEEVTLSVQPYREEIIKALDDVSTWNDPASLKLLEIGPGTGENLPHLNRLAHRSKISWTGVEPNPVLLRALEDKLDSKKVKLPGSGHKEEVLELQDTQAYATSAEAHLKAGGEKTQGFDVVLSTLVLCSVNDQAEVLSQVKQALKGDKKGRFVFLEHVAEPWTGHRWMRFLQEWLSPLWRLIAGGCELHRETQRAILNAGFVDLQVKETTVWVFKGLLPLPIVYGVAYKP